LAILLLYFSGFRRFWSLLVVVYDIGSTRIIVPNVVNGHIAYRAVRRQIAAVVGYQNSHTRPVQIQAFFDVLDSSEYLVHLVFPRNMRLNQRLDRRFDMPRQLRPELDKVSQFGIIAQDFVQAGGQDRILIFCKCFIIKRLSICLKGFDSPWGYLRVGAGKRADRSLFAPVAQYKTDGR